MENFESTRNKELELLSESNDIEFLKKELKKANDSLPDCAAEGFFRMNKIGIIQNRIHVLSSKT